MKKIISYIVFLGILLGTIVGYYINFGTAIVDGNSMLPTYRNNDFILVRKVKNIKFGDIVAINSNTLNEYLCKRVIGVAGDHIVINNKGLYVNKKRISENYVASNKWYSNSEEIDVEVPKNSVFVLGDNRNNSTDSRILGCLKTKDIYGVCIYNITKSTGITKSMLFKFTIVIWVLFLLICIFSKEKNS